mmetsp:Transcript_9493/g.10426  ORF Transcript_9493/g.10426 Transcript_9493/m.10426 type:complete len:121 (+) Transcript_9493:531-893(+)
MIYLEREHHSLKCHLKRRKVFGEEQSPDSLLSGARFRMTFESFHKSKSLPAVSIFRVEPPLFVIRTFSPVHVCVCVRKREREITVRHKIFFIQHHNFLPRFPLEEYDFSQMTTVFPVFGS